MILFPAALACVSTLSSRTEGELRFLMTSTKPGRLPVISACGRKHPGVRPRSPQCSVGGVLEPVLLMNEGHPTTGGQASVWTKWGTLHRVWANAGNATVRTWTGFSRGEDGGRGCGAAARWWWSEEHLGGHQRGADGPACYVRRTQTCPFKPVAACHRSFKPPLSDQQPPPTDLPPRRLQCPPLSNRAASHTAGEGSAP